MLLEAFILGIVYGFGPCTFSCAPVLVPIIMSTSKDYKQGLLYTLAFSLGRIVIYFLLGLIMGAIGKVFEPQMPAWLLGSFLIVLGIALMFNIQKKCLVPKVKITGLHMSFIAGIVMGISPCAPLVGALGLAVASRSILLGGLIALVFGIGTVLSPILLIGTAAGKWSSIKEFSSVNNYVAGGFLIVIGLGMLFQ